MEGLKIRRKNRLRRKLVTVPFKERRHREGEGGIEKDHGAVEKDRMRTEERKESRRRTRRRTGRRGLRKGGRSVKGKKEKSKEIKLIVLVSAVD